MKNPISVLTLSRKYSGILRKDYQNPSILFSTCFPFQPSSRCYRNVKIKEMLNAGLNLDNAYVLPTKKFLAHFMKYSGMKTNACSYQNNSVSIST